MTPPITHNDRRKAKNLVLSLRKTCSRKEVAAMFGIPYLYVYTIECMTMRPDGLAYAAPEHAIKKVLGIK